MQHRAEWNSFTHLSMRASIEEEFNVSLSSAEMSAMTSVSIMISVIQLKLNL